MPFRRLLAAAALVAAALTTPAHAVDPTVTITGAGTAPAAVRGEITLDTATPVTTMTGTLSGTYLMLVVADANGDATVAEVRLPGWVTRSVWRLKASPTLSAGRNVVTAVSDGAFTLTMTTPGLSASETLDLTTPVTYGVAAQREPLARAGGVSAGTSLPFRRPTASVTMFGSWARLDGTSAPVAHHRNCLVETDPVSMTALPVNGPAYFCLGSGEPVAASQQGAVAVVWPTFVWPEAGYTHVTAKEGAGAAYVTGERILLSLPLS